MFSVERASGVKIEILEKDPGNGQCPLVTIGQVHGPPFWSGKYGTQYEGEVDKRVLRALDMKAVKNIQGALLWEDGGVWNPVAIPMPNT